MADEQEAVKGEVVILGSQDLTKAIQNVKKQEKFKYFDREEINSLLRGIPQNKPKHLMFFQFLWRTGCRVTEAITVSKAALNFDDAFMTIRWLKSRKYLERKIPMHSSLRNPLYMYCSNLKHADRLFDFSRQRADQLAKKYGFGHCHVLRHSFAVNFIKQKKDAWALRILQKLLGHNHIQTTMQYLDVIPVDQAEAIEEVKFD